MAFELAHRRSCQELADRTPPRLNLSCPLFVPFLPSRPHRTDCPPSPRPTHDDSRNFLFTTAICVLPAPFIFSAGGSRSRLRTRSLRINVAESSTQHPRIVSAAIAEPPTPRSYSRASFDCVNPLLSLIPLSKTAFQSVRDYRDFPLDKSPFFSPLHHGGRVLSRLEPINTTLTTNTDSAPVGVICDIFCHAMRLPSRPFQTAPGYAARSHRFVRSLRAIALADPTCGSTFSLISYPPIFYVFTSTVSPVCISTWSLPTRIQSPIPSSATRRTGPADSS